MSLSDYLVISSNVACNLEDYEDGDVSVHKNGDKIYKKEIVSNLPNEDVILITAISIDILYITQNEVKNHYASKGCYTITLNKAKGDVLLFKYL